MLRLIVLLVPSPSKTLGLFWFSDSNPCVVMVTPLCQGSHERYFCGGPNRDTTGYLRGLWCPERGHSFGTLLDKQGNGPDLDS